MVIVQSAAGSNPVNVITRADILGAQAPTLTAQPVQNASASLGEVSKIMGQFKDILSGVTEIQKMRMEMTGGQPTDGFNGVAPSQQPTTPSDNNPRIEYREKEVIKPMELDKDKVKNLMREVIVDGAKHLPKEVKEMSLDQISGKNFTELNLKVKKMGMNITVTGDDILEVVASKIIEAYPNLVKNDEEQNT